MLHRLTTESIEEIKTIVLGERKWITRWIRERWLDKWTMGKLLYKQSQTVCDYIGTPLYNRHYWNQQTCPFNRGVLCWGGHLTPFSLLVVHHIYSFLFAHFFFSTPGTYNPYNGHPWIKDTLLQGTHSISHWAHFDTLLEGLDWEIWM